MDTALIDIAGRALSGIGWVFLPFALLPLLMLVLPKAGGLARFLGTVCRLIDDINVWIGEAVKWLLVAMVISVAFAVIALSIFGQAWPKLDESTVYMHAAVILLGSAATLLAGQHVRVDIFHSRMSPKRKALVEILGFYALLLPFCLVLIWDSQTFVALAWVSLEGSTESSGIQGVFLLKTLLPVFGVMMLAQGLSIAGRGALLLTEQDSPPLPAHIDPLFDGEEHLEAGL